MAAAFEIGGGQASGGMAHEYDFADAVVLHFDECGVYVGEIAGHVAYVKRFLSGGQRASVAAQVHGIEVVAVVNKAVAHFLLEEVVVESVDIQHSAAHVRSRRGRVSVTDFAYDG